MVLLVPAHIAEILLLSTHVPVYFLHLFKLRFFTAKCTNYIALQFQVNDLQKSHDTFKKLKNAQNSLWEAEAVFSKNDHRECGHLPGWSSVQFSDNIVDFPRTWNSLRALKLCAIYRQSCMEFLTILGTTALRASSFRHTGQIQSCHHQNLTPYPKTAFDIAQILFTTFYFIFSGDKLWS